MNPPHTTPTPPTTAPPATVPATTPHPASSTDAREPRQRPIGSSIRDYWTDGSISALCARISELSAVPVELRDERDLVLPPGSSPDAPGIAAPIPEGSTVIPIVIEDEHIGSVVVHPAPPDRHQPAAAAGRLIANATREICTDVSELRHRVAEIDTLYRLSAMLVKGGDVEDTLDAALRSALEVLELDAGSIMLLPEDADGLAKGESEADLERSVSVNLSEHWLSNPLPLSRDREFDRRALAGEVVVSENLADDPRVLLPEQCVEEGLGAYMGAGMVFDKRPIGVIRVYDREPREFSRAERRLLRSIAQSAAASIEQARLIRLRARERRTQRALRIAGAVQQRMMPDKVPVVPGVDLAARYRPSHEIGGDFYDLFESHGRLAVVVGDVVGKGVAAGLLMSAVRATMRAYAELSDDLSRVLARTNDALCRDTTVNEFATIWMGTIDPHTRELRYVSAGHDRPLLFRRDEHGLWIGRTLEGGGLVAGVSSGESYPVQMEKLIPGDVLIAYTDGITDAQSFGNERFGRPRLVSAIGSTLSAEPGLSAAELVERVFWAVRQFTGLHQQADDETLVVARIV
ncbi:MAG: SpoIIE family protein phosphatase [Phycisphaerales bacterium]|nr:SpoIIE family protein phosphatase [Planctomycetota bacterium]MCH8509792.1 SpoIIE family protein phosphatase [Phycisphaerales bacterium]